MFVNHVRKKLHIWVVCTEGVQGVSILRTKNLAKKIYKLSIKINTEIGHNFFRSEKDTFHFSVGWLSDSFFWNVVAMNLSSYLGRCPLMWIHIIIPDRDTCIVISWKEIIWSKLNLYFSRRCVLELSYCMLILYSNFD